MREVRFYTEMHPMIYFKIIASAVIIVSSTGIGFYIERYLQKELKEIEGILLFTNILKGQLEYAVAMLSEIMEQAGEKIDGIVGMWLMQIWEMMQRDHVEDFQSIWNESISFLRTGSHLNNRILERVGELGTLLGYMDLHTQLSNICVWEKNMLFEYDSLKARTGSYGRLAKSMGFFGGILLVILFL